ncbi:MAG: hypothetical protein O2812_04550 [Chloroflexi bacterium]|nr:hypothetical protein [Chloroflexota bacterium]
MPPKKSKKLAARQVQPGKRRVQRQPNVPSLVAIPQAHDPDVDSEDIAELEAVAQPNASAPGPAAAITTSRVSRRERANVTALATASLRNEVTRIGVVMSVITLALVVLKVTDVFGA